MVEVRPTQRVELDEATAFGKSTGSARTNSTAPATASIPSRSARMPFLDALVELGREQPPIRSSIAAMKSRPLRPV